MATQTKFSRQNWKLCGTKEGGKSKQVFFGTHENQTKINQDNKTSFLKLSVQPFRKKVVDQTSLLPHKNTIKLCGTIFFKIN